ncbi:MAG: NAD-dependent epimerase/dehydratase family protein [Candidatus Wallbacteria bacterium]|nr:NAD-dependent epimerase/dehydratase family protein [Candidatus Wallbacteria bacterium]
MDLADRFRGKRCLITGGLGFIGSNLAERLSGYGAWVTVVDSLIEGYGGNLFNVESIKDRVRINISDVRDQSSTNWLVRGQDYLFNLAGTLSHIDSMTDPFTDLEINCRSQLSILESCRKFNPAVKVIFSGTRGQYGRAQYLPVDEKHPLCPTDTNGINNTAGEWYHILYNNVYGIRAVSLRLTNVFGPRHQMRHSRQGYLNWFVRLAIDGEKIQIYGDGAQLRDFNYVDDVVEALLLAGAVDSTNGEIYNLGSGAPVSVVDSARAVLEAAGTGQLDQVPFPEEKKKIEVGDYYADFGKFKQVTGWEPRVSFPEGLRRTVKYYRKNKEQYW